ncbi:MAG: hypothetical protein HRF49_12085 [bacterium]
MKCFYHLETEAAGECSVCGKPLCVTCIAEAGTGGICRRCKAERESRSKEISPASGILSLIIPGFGQLVRGEFLKAAAIFILFVYAMSQELFAVGLVVYAFGAWDGFKRLLTEDDLGLSYSSGRLYAGLLLILFGVGLLPGPLKGVLRLEWIVPAILVIFGVILVSSDNGGRKAAAPGGNPADGEKGK